MSDRSMTAPPVNLLEAVERLKYATDYPAVRTKHGERFNSDKALVDCSDVRALLTLARQAQAAQEENERLNERLENNRVFNAAGERVNVEPGSIPDGIECRDETIRLQEANCQFLRAEVTRLQSLVDEASVFVGRTAELMNNALMTPQGSRVSVHLTRATQLFDTAASFLTRLRAQPNTTKPAMDREPEGEGT